MGEHDQAIAVGQRALALAMTSGAFDVQVIAQTYLGKAYHAVGDFQQALDVSRQVMALLTGELLYARLGRVAPPALTSRGLCSLVSGRTGGLHRGHRPGRRGGAAGRGSRATLQYCWCAYILLVCSTAVKGCSIRRSLCSNGAWDSARAANIPLFFPLIASSWGRRMPLPDVLRRRSHSWTRCWSALPPGAAYANMRRAHRAEQGPAPRRPRGRGGALAERLLDLSRTHTGHGYQAHAYRLLGDVATHRDPPDIAQAEAHYHQALALAEELGMRPLQAHCHRGLGTLYAKLGQPEPARTALSAAIDLYRAMEMTFWLPQAEAALAAVYRETRDGKVDLSLDASIMVGVPAPQCDRLRHRQAPPV